MIVMIKFSSHLYFLESKEEIKSIHPSEDYLNSCFVKKKNEE